MTAAPDAIDEDDETIVVAISSATNATEAGEQQVTATIADDDAAPDVTLTLTGSPFAETGGSATVTATLSAISARSVTMTFNFGGTAANPADYTVSASSITINPGSTTGSITLNASRDSLDESDETIVITSAAAAQELTATITDDDAPPTVTLGVTNSPLAENGGIAVITATLSSVSAQPVTVNLAFSGTAGSGDFAASGATLTIDPGAITASITITGTDDLLDEADETVIVDIASVTHGTENGSQQITATIADDDASPSVALSISTTALAENGGVATVTATLSAVSAQTVTVSLAFSGTATTSADYSASATTITVPAGSTSASMTLTAIDDTVGEPEETIVIDIASVTNGSEDSTQQVTATVSDDDPTHLAFLSHPSTANTGAVITPAVTVQLLDINNQVVNTTRSVTLALGTNPSAATLGGTTTIAAVAGVATFANLTVDRTGSGYTLTATSAGLTGAMSSEFTIVQGASAVVSGDASICFGESATITVSLQGTAPWHLTWSDGFTETVSVSPTTRVVAPESSTTYSLTSFRDDRGIGTMTGSASVLVGELAPPVISALPSVSLGSALTLSATPGLALYQWFHDGVAIAGAVGPTLTIDSVTESAAGSYTVTAWDGACSATSAAVVVSISANEAIVAVLGATQGAGGALFRTTMQLSNDSDSAIEGSIHVFAPAAALANAPYLYSLGAHETRFFDDLVPFGAGLASANVVPKTGAAPLGLVHVFNDMGALGTTGMIERPVRIDRVLGAGDRAVLIAPADAEATRFNVGVRALTEGLTLHGVVRDASGAVRTQFDRTYGVSTFAQASAASFAGITLSGSDVIVLEVTSGRGVIYGAATDNRTNDPNMQFAQTVRSSEGEMRYVMTVVGSTAGNFGSRFKTGVQLHNPTEAELEAQLVFHPAGRTGSDADLAMPVKLAPNATQSLSDLLATMGTTGVGSLDLVTTSKTRPIAVVRVYSISDAGETSMTEDLFATSEALRAGQSAVLLAPHDPTAARFNIGVRSLSDGAKITAVVRSAAGEVVKRISLSYPPTYFEQRSAADHLGITVNGDESVTYTVDEGAALVYGVWTDNKTQDPSLHFAVAK